MYTEPVIVNGEAINARCYVKFYHYGKLQRIYNGKTLNIRCFPNEAKNVSERLRLLEQLRFDIKKRLEKGWNPGVDKKIEDPYRGYTIQMCLVDVITEIKKEDISKRYQEDLGRISNELVNFLNKENLKNIPRSDIDQRLIQRFLSRYSSSSSYYMTKRRTLAGLFARLVGNGMLSQNPVHGTARKKGVHILNAVFPATQLKGLLSHLEKNHPQLYLCAILMYGCFLRPHREVRLLKRSHLNETCTTITLSGKDNKSKRVRVISVPRYVTQALISHGVLKMSPDQFVVIGSDEPVNEDYFTTAWTRQKRNFPTPCSLTEGQTLYSFRHSGAVAVYEKTKDPFKVQQAMGHSSLTVTLRYLRSLGVGHAVEELPDL